jgi:hypothetical protein
VAEGFVIGAEGLQYRAPRTPAAAAADQAADHA